jgi:predicted transposase YbfD/YdcC
LKGHFPLNGKEYPIHTAETNEKSHGRIESRRIEVAQALPGYPNWPGAQQVFRIHRTRIEQGQITQECICGITSLSQSKADAFRLLSLVRNHWQIENGLHHIRDVTLNEDRSRIRNRNKAKNFAAFRSLVITLLRRCGYDNILEGIEFFAEEKEKALHLVRFERTE